MTTQEPRLLYILRSFPELSETFVLREIQALRGAGVPVSVLAIHPGAHADLVGGAESGPEGLPPFRYLSRRWGDARGGAELAGARRGPLDGPLSGGPVGRSDRSRGVPSDAAAPAPRAPGTDSGLEGGPIPAGSGTSARVRQDRGVASGSDRSAAPGDPRGAHGPIPTVADRPVSRPGAGRAREIRNGESRGGPSSSFLGQLARDLAAQGGHLRRTARALRLAALARRARALVPPGTVRLHAHFANDAAALARYVAALAGIPYRVTAHAYDIYQDPFLLGANLAGAERVYTVARANLDALRARASADGWDARKLSVLHCGIDLAAFPYRDPSPRAGGGPARLLSVARLVPKKGFLGLLDAIARVGTPAGGSSATPADGRSGGDGPAVHLTIAGDGPQAGEIAARVAAADLSGRVTLLGAVPSSRVRELMREADLFVLASRVAADGDRDGLPVALIEAMALGLPVLTTPVAGIPELVDDASGRLVSGDGPDPLAAAIHAALAESAERRIEKARRARRKVEAEFDLAAQVAALRP